MEASQRQSKEEIQVCEKEDWSRIGRPEDCERIAGERTHLRTFLWRMPNPTYPHNYNVNNFKIINQLMWLWADAQI